MENSHIEWTNHTFNPWWGCEKVSAGCKNCYAQALDNRYHNADPHWGPGSSRKPMSESYWQQPLKWNADAGKAGIKAKVFCASMADVFEDHPDVIVWRARLFATIEETPNLIWQLLTKRPENISKLSPINWAYNEFPDNVWIGTSVEDQDAADKRIPQLLQVPVKVKFLSCEPLLGPVDIDTFLKPSKWWYQDGSNQGFTLPAVAWVICGGESGHGARPMHPDWARSLRDQCTTRRAAFFFKQWGEYWPAGKSIVENKEMLLFGGEAIYKVGKKAAGSLLDGMEYKQFPND